MTEEYFNKVYQETKKYILSKILKFDVNWQTAEDILQKVYFKFFAKGEDTWEMGQCVNWLKITAKTTTINHLTHINLPKRALEFCSPLPNFSTITPEQSGVSSESVILCYPDQTILTGFEKILKNDGSDDVGILKKIIDELPKKQKKVIQLFYFEGYKTNEIASKIKINQSCVNFHLSDGRDKIRKKLKYVQDLL
jgi:RNA polymerase sigma factor (sigma-70 family)